MVAGDNTITTIPIIKSNWINGISYNNTEKRWVATQLTFYNQAGWTGNVSGFGIPIIKSDKNNSFITLPENLSGDYLFSYTTNNTPTLKKIDTSLLALTDAGLLIHNGTSFTSLKSNTNGNYYLSFSNCKIISSFTR